MGQEWAASSPFLFFTDHDPELGRLVSEGRREEFKSFEACATPEGRAAIPDPPAEDTFLRSKLIWEERERDEHGRVLRLYRRLLELRRTDPVWRANAGGRRGLSARATGKLLAVRRQTPAGTRVLMMNFGDAPAPADAWGEGGLALVRSDDGPTGEPLTAIPPFTAVVLADRISGAGPADDGAAPEAPETD
jgi:maltooligosyltrehalose trehalohydrolase